MYKKVKSVSASKSKVSIKKFAGKKIKKNKKYYIYVATRKTVGKRTYTSGQLYFWDSKGGNDYIN